MQIKAVIFYSILLVSCYKHGSQSSISQTNSSKRQLADTSCVDPTKIDTNSFCIQVYDPVCGCDGKTYSNSCMAEKSGVLKWTKGECAK